jgi:hypothetical protein
LRYTPLQPIHCLPVGFGYDSSVPKKPPASRSPRPRGTSRTSSRPHIRRQGVLAGNSASPAYSAVQRIPPSPTSARPYTPVDAPKGSSDHSSAGDSHAIPCIFLLSPANISGIRARLILREEACFPLALRLREGQLSLGEAFAFISGLYFRGKLAYAKAFARPPADIPGALVITACGGLLPPDLLLNRETLRAISSAPVAASERRYRVPLERDARLVADHLLANPMGRRCQIVLLGSIVTPKYIEPLQKIFGELLLFPAEFAGRGDMSRGGLMLRCARSGQQLTYVPVSTAKRHGTRPPKLAPMPKWSSVDM